MEELFQIISSLCSDRGLACELRSSKIAFLVHNPASASEYEEFFSSRFSILVIFIRKKDLHFKLFYGLKNMIKETCFQNLDLKGKFISPDDFFFLFNNPLIQNDGSSISNSK